jgi:hypothetical protein
MGFGCSSRRCDDQGTLAYTSVDTRGVASTQNAKWSNTTEACECLGRVLAGIESSVRNTLSAGPSNEVSLDNVHQHMSHLSDDNDVLEKLARQAELCGKELSSVLSDPACESKTKGQTERLQALIARADALATTIRAKQKELFAIAKTVLPTWGKALARERATGGSSTSPTPPLPSGAAATMRAVCAKRATRGGTVIEGAIPVTFPSGKKGSVLIMGQAHVDLSVSATAAHMGSPEIVGSVRPDDYKKLLSEFKASAGDKEHQDAQRRMQEISNVIRRHRVTTVGGEFHPAPEGLDLRRPLQMRRDEIAEVLVANNVEDVDAAADYLILLENDAPLFMALKGKLRVPLQGVDHGPLAEEQQQSAVRKADLSASLSAAAQTSADKEAFQALLAGARWDDWCKGTPQGADAEHLVEAFSADALRLLAKAYLVECASFVAIAHLRDVQQAKNALALGDSSKSKTPVVLIIVGDAHRPGIRRELEGHRAP